MRRDDWLTRLIEQIVAAGTRAFAWGQQDCCLFAARCVDAQTGGAFEAELAAAYQDMPTALRFLVREGGLKKALTKRLGDPVPWWKARRGDLCLVETPDGVGSVGVCLGATIACVHLEAGLEYLPIDKATDAWVIQ